MFEVGDIVRIAEKWLNSDEERKYRYVVLETGFCGNRIKIGCLNSMLTLGSVEVVDEDMIVMATGRDVAGM